MDKLIDQYWFPTCQPWFKGADIGTGILAGSEDPHLSVWVADFSDMAERLQDHEPMLQTEARDHVAELVNHIIETHNKWVDDKQAESRKRIGLS